MELQRATINELRAWKNSPYRKPLVLQGARQVGKSWLLKKFGATDFKNFVIVNFDGEREVKDFFSKTKNVRRIVEYLSLAKGVKIEPQTTLIIFDEIQECNDALNALKYFCEDAPEYAVACAGSLLGVALGRSGSSFPVGKVDFMHIYPLSFTEFLRAESPNMASFIDTVTEISPLPELFFSQLTDLYKAYHLCGGMPEAVSRYVETHDVEAVGAVLRHISMAYALDFSKHIEARDIPRVHQVWDNMQEQLAKENKRFQYNLIAPSARAREYEVAVNWLSIAGMVHKVYGTETVKLPIEAYKKSSSFKLYLNDVGLLRQMFRLDAPSIVQGNSLFTEFKGILTENYVLNSLVRQWGHTPLFWSSGNRAELEFLLQEGDHIIPIEAKSGESVKSRSLTEYRKTYQPALAIRFSLKNLHYDSGLLNIPLFLVDKTKEWVSRYV